MTKGVVSVLVGRAVQLGLIRVDDPIGRYVRVADPAKAALTVRQFLNQVTGIRMMWANDVFEAASTDSAAALFARPFQAVPGTTFLYAQTTITALVSVLEAAIGEDVQTFAQREVFGPIGIDRHEWRWARDGSGRTQGFAFLDMTPRAFARIGLLLLHGGEWSGRRLLPADYVTEGAKGTTANGCYGFLWWTNDGTTCHNAGFPADELYQHRWIASAPPDAFGLSGMFDQTVVVIPSLDMVVVRMGLPHELLADPLGDVKGQKPKWDYRFFRLLLAGVTDTPLPDPGDWVPDPPDPPVDWTHILPVPLPDPVHG
jgi:CubicO group peptidase (beta-lactamase class C family)